MSLYSKIISISRIHARNSFKRAHAFRSFSTQNHQSNNKKNDTEDDADVEYDPYQVIASTLKTDVRPAAPGMPHPPQPKPAVLEKASEETHANTGDASKSEMFSFHFDNLEHAFKHPPTSPHPHVLQCIRRGFFMRGMTLMINESRFSDKLLAPIASLRMSSKPIRRYSLFRVLQTVLALGTALYAWYLYDVNDYRRAVYRMQIDGTPDEDLPPSLTFGRWWHSKIVRTLRFISAPLSALAATAVPDAALRSFAMLPVDAQRQQYNVWTRSGLLPSPSTTEPATGETFPAADLISAPASITRVLPQAQALLGVGLRSMMGLWWLPYARAYSYAVYADATHCVSRVLSPEPPSAPSDLSAEFAALDSKSVVLKFAQDSAGSHIAHGFERSVGNRIDDGRAKFDFMGRRIEQPAAPATAPPAETPADPAEEKKRQLQRLNFVARLRGLSAPPAQEAVPDSHGLAGALALEALRVVADNVPSFSRGDRIAFSWGRSMDRTLVSLHAHSDVDHAALLSATPVSAASLKLLQTRVADAYRSKHGDLVPKPVVDAVATAATQSPNCWKHRVDGVYVFDPSPAVAYLNAVVDRALAHDLPTDPAASAAVPAAAAPADWLTANMSADQRARFFATTGLSSTGLPPPPAIFSRKPVRHMRVLIESPVLANAIADTYVGPRSVNTSVSQEIHNFWKNYTKRD